MPFQRAWFAEAFIPAMFPLLFRDGILAMAVYHGVLAVDICVPPEDRAGHGS